MSFQASDGRVFPSEQQRQKYDAYVSAINAPGGPTQKHETRMHGVPRKVTIEREGNGRWRVTANHPDGHVSTVVHGSNESAHGVVGDYMAVNPPIAADLHRNASNHPVGPRESSRLAREDGREEERQ